LVQLLLRR